MSTDEALFQELLQTFKVEASEHIETLNQALLRLERTSDDKRYKELLQEAFRAAHSLKGSARTVSFDDIEGLAHSLESVLHKARSDQMTLDPATCDVLYATLDVIKKLLNGEQLGLDSIYSKLSEVGIEPPANISPLPVAEDEPSVLTASGDDTIRVAITKLDNLMAQTGDLLISKIDAEQHVSDMQVIRSQLAAWPRMWRDIKALLPQVHGPRETQLLDLLNRHNEQLQALSRDVNTLYQSVNRDTVRLGMVTVRVQDEVRRVRMVPFQTITLSLQRAVRDAARITDKQIAPLTIDGGEVELDKKLLEALKDPLIHLLNNAVSHGIEASADRLTANKPAEGRVTLSVSQRGNEVHIVIHDDGRGFDLDGLRTHGIDKGLKISDHPDADELIALAFLPGVTTAKHLTSLSGRGVGLDVVRDCVEALQGRILVESVPGQGTTFQIVAPVSLAMTRGLLVKIGGERYLLPLLYVEKILKSEVSFTIEGQSMIMLDGKPWPLVSLAAVLKRPVKPNKASDHRLAVVIRVAAQRVALLVDEVLTEQELAVKPLSSLLGRVPNVTGAALLGNGQPVVVLNATDLIRTARGVDAEVIHAHEKDGHDSNDSSTVGVRILVVDDSITTRTLEKNILQAAGFEVITATDGVLALQQLKQQDIDLVVSDVQMPNMDGISLTRHLRENREFANLPIILVTSLESKEDREQGLLVGANAYIVKRGFDQAELLSVIRQLL